MRGRFQTSVCGAGAGSYRFRFVRVSYQDGDVAACETQPAHDRQRPQFLEGDEESRFV